MREMRRNSNGHGVPPIVRLARPNWTSRDRRNATATNGYPVFLDGSVNCLTHRQKVFSDARDRVMPGNLQDAAGVAFEAGACRNYMASFRSIRSKDEIPSNL
jgi:hypothetical protein